MTDDDNTGATATDEASAALEPSDDKNDNEEQTTGAAEAVRSIANKALEDLRSGKAKIRESAPFPPENDILSRPPRKVVLSAMADIERRDPDGNVTVTECPRAVYRLVDMIASMPQDGTYSVYLKEDEERSDMPREGEERIRRLFQPEEWMSAPELIRWLGTQFLSPRQAVVELQRTIAGLAMHSELKNCMVTIVFDGSRPSGFTFSTDASEETIADIEALGDATARMLDGYKSDMRKAHPGKVAFSDDGDIVLPSTVDVGRLTKSADMANRLMRKS